MYCGNERDDLIRLTISVNHKLVLRTNGEKSRNMQTLSNLNPRIKFDPNLDSRHNASVTIQMKATEQY